MAARKSTFENRAQRRMEMVKMRLDGKTYGQIGHKFGVTPKSARMVVTNALKGESNVSDTNMG